jgi:hypothetical protein
MRREFVLPEDDLDHLSSLSLEWETFQEGKLRWLLIHQYPVPNGYNTSAVDIAILIEPGYPVAQLDMAYFWPHLQLLNQKQISALAFHPVEGKIYQRWSRHRTGTNPWRPGLDDLSTHLASVNFWFERELRK